ncbi:MAG: transposase [Betaproteobacteria bacterium]
MARRPRFSLVDLPLHVVQRGNDRHACFFRERDYHVYLKYLREGCGRYGVQVHAYVLMTNHVHLMLTPLVVGAVSRMMALLGARYVRYINRTTNRTGTLWEGIPRFARGMRFPPARDLSLYRPESRPRRIGSSRDGLPLEQLWSARRAST